MKMVKSLILGSAAGLVAMSGAQAADLPVKAKAVEYVRICSLYGAGFWYIPGTDTCIKLGGYLRAEVLINSNSVDTGNTNLPASATNRMANAYTWRSREDLTIDTRTATEYGVVRTFFDATFTWTTDSYTQSGTVPGSTVYSQLGATGVGAPANAGSGNTSFGQLGVYYAFIQFAGFTFGKAVSAFDAPFVSYPANNFDGLVGGGGTITGVNQFTYTAQFGGGWSGTVSVQDQVAYYQAGVNNISAGGAFGTSDYANTVAPDVVAALQVDQVWGTAKFSAAAHDNHVAYYGATEPTGHPDDKWGFAVQGALSVKADSIAPGDVFNISAVYTDGATRYNIQNLAGAFGAAQIYGGSNVAYQSVGFGVAPDTLFAVGTQQQLVQTWGMRGGYTHNWDPYWNSSIYGAYAAVRYNDNSKSFICGGVVNGIAFAGSFRGIANAAAGGITTCNPDYNVAQIGFVTRWTPVKNLTFSADFTYEHLDQKMAGFVTAANASVFKPAVAYELRDQDTAQLLLRVQRNW
jgi:hypothetical protein